MDSNISTPEDPDDTLLSSQDDDIILRSESLQADVDHGRFDILLQPTKRTLKNKQLSEECFNFNVYVQKQCGFLTTRPLFWMKKIEAYITTKETVSGLVRYKKLKNSEKYISALIDIAYETTRKVAMVINFQTGVVMVKGDNFEHWIRTEFGRIEPSLLPTDDVPKEEATTGNETDETRRQLESLWHEHDSLKISIENIDEQQRVIRKDISTYFEAHNSAALDVADIYKEIQNADAKLTTFMKTTTKTCEGLLKSEISKIHRRIDKLSDKFMEFNESLNQRFENLSKNQHAVNANVDRIQQLVLDLETQKKEIKEVINDYRMFHEGNDVETVSDSANKRKITAMSQDMEQQQQQILQLTKELTEFKEDTTNSLQQKASEDGISIDDMKDKIEEMEGMLKRTPDHNETQYSPSETEEKIKKLEEELKQLGRAAVNKPQPTKLNTIFCMDSNSKFIKFNKLWTTKNSMRRRCYTHPQLRTFITELNAESVETFLIHIGVNDIDNKSGQEVFDEMKESISLIKSKYPDAKIVLSEVTPRKDERDVEGDTCNRLLNEWAPSQVNLFIANHASIRGDKKQFLHDNKHISRKSLGVFVVNLKRALCKATGSEYVGRAGYNNAIRNAATTEGITTNA